MIHADLKQEKQETPTLRSLQGTPVPMLQGLTASMHEPWPSFRSICMCVCVISTSSAILFDMKEVFQLNSQDLRV